MTEILSEQELHARVQALSTQVEELTQRMDQSGSIAGGGEAPGLLFSDVEAWVGGMFLPMFGWRIDGQRWFWCPQWWRHAEAIWRLELLWRSWEAARLHPLGMSGWSAELDRHKWELLGDEGPFRQCRAAERDRPARHVELEPAGAEPAPPGWWEISDPPASGANRPPAAGGDDGSSQRAHRSRAAGAALGEERRGLG